MYFSNGKRAGASTYGVVRATLGHYTPNHRGLTPFVPPIDVLKLVDGQKIGQNKGSKNKTFEGKIRSRRRRPESTLASRLVMVGLCGTNMELSLAFPRTINNFLELPGKCDFF